MERYSQVKIRSWYFWCPTKSQEAQGTQKLLHWPKKVITSLNQDRVCTNVPAGHLKLTKVSRCSWKSIVMRQKSSRMIFLFYFLWQILQAHFLADPAQLQVHKSHCFSALNQLKIHSTTMIWATLEAAFWNDIISTENRSYFDALCLYGMDGG